MVRASARVVAVTVAGVVTLLTWATTGSAVADTPVPVAPGTSTSPTPSPSPHLASSPAPSLPPASSPTPAVPPPPTPVPSPTPTAGGTPSGGNASPLPTAPRSRATAAPLTLVVAPVGGPVAGSFYEDLGSFGFSGTTELADGSTIDVQRRVDASTWATVATTRVKDHAYAARSRVQGRGGVTFRGSAKGSEGASVTSAPASVTVKDATVSVDVAGKVDSLKNIGVRGRVVPARAGVEVRLDLRRGSAWKPVLTARTVADGTFSTSLAYGKGALEGYALRTRFWAANRPRWEVSGTGRTTRVAVLDAAADATTRADVAKTYRSGCPVGPSRLTTIHLNYYGRDKRMHRGVIIVRSDLRQRIVRAFDAALVHRYPIDKMKNPNDYGGNDPRQMRANNTSGFNCRKVVGNPYAQSPHSYGIALDVNTVQNPYRDDNGKWWPSDAKKYRDRSPLQWGMLGYNSSLTKSLRTDHYFWGGLWNPGRDYQHFEYHG